MLCLKWHPFKVAMVNMEESISIVIKEKMNLGGAVHTSSFAAVLLSPLWELYQRPFAAYKIDATGAGGTQSERDCAEEEWRFKEGRGTGQRKILKPRLEKQRFKIFKTQIL